MSIKADEKQVMLSNKRFFRPAEAWHAIGVLKPPVWTTKQGANYIPWPKFGKYGEVIGKNIAQFTDLDKIKQLNKSHIADKMEVCNRAVIDNVAKEHHIIKSAENVKQTIETLPMEAKGIKGGPAFPAPTVPDVSGDLNFLMSTWATQEYSKIFQRLQKIRRKIQITYLHPYIPTQTTPIVISGTTLTSNGRSKHNAKTKVRCHSLP